MTHTPVITALKNCDRRFEPLGFRTEFWETAEKVGNEIDPSGELQQKVRRELARQGIDELAHVGESDVKTDRLPNPN